MAEKCHRTYRRPPQKAAATSTYCLLYHTRRNPCQTQNIRDHRRMQEKYHDSGTVLYKLYKKPAVCLRSSVQLGQVLTFKDFFTNQTYA